MESENGEGSRNEQQLVIDYQLDVKRFHIPIHIVKCPHCGYKHSGSIHMYYPTVGKEDFQEYECELCENVFGVTYILHPITVDVTVEM